MITDSMLKKAAEDYANAYLAAIDREFADVPEHQFSPEFEQKIEKLGGMAAQKVFGVLVRMSIFLLDFLKNTLDIFGNLSRAVEISGVVDILKHVSGNIILGAVDKQSTVKI